MTDFTVEQMMKIQEIKLLRDLDDLTGRLEIMVFLYKFERGNISAFIKDLRLNQQPVYRTLDRLSDLGLIETKTEPAQRRRKFKTKFYYLTAAGRKVAKPLVGLYEEYRKIKEAEEKQNA